MQNTTDHQLTLLTDMQSTEQEKDKTAKEEQKTEGSTMKRILLGRSETGDSAINRLKKPWPKAMEADDEEGRHRLVLESGDSDKVKSSKKVEASKNGAAAKKEGGSAAAKDDKKAGPVKLAGFADPIKLAGFADPKPVGASPIKKVETVNVKKDSAAASSAKKEEPKVSTSSDKKEEAAEKPSSAKKVEKVIETKDAVMREARAPLSSSPSHSDEENDAAETLKGFMQLGARPFSSAPVAAGDAIKPKSSKPSSPSSSSSKSVSKKPLPTKRSRDSTDETASPSGSSSVAPPSGPVVMGKDGKPKKQKQQGPPVKKRKVPLGKDGKKMGKEKGDKSKKIKGEGKKKIKGEKTRKPQALPEILMDLLNKNVAPDAIFWLPGQQIFLINKENFKKKVIPKYFNGKTFTSITKSLNLWNFTKAPKAQLPPNTVGYHHKLFQKDAPHLLKQMVDGGGAGDPNSKNNEAHPLPPGALGGAKKAHEVDVVEAPKPINSPPGAQPTAAAVTGLATLGELAASAAPAAQLQPPTQLDPQQAELEALQSRSLQLAAEREALMQSMLGQQQAGLGGGDAATLEMFRQRQAGFSNPGEMGGLSELDLLRERAAAGGDSAALEMLRQQQQQQQAGDEHGGYDHASLLELAEQQRNSAMERAIAERMMLEREDRKSVV